MTVIRREQIRTFQEASLRSFEQEMIGHLKTFAPKLSEVAGDSGVRSAVHLGLERGRQYGFSSRGPLRFYLELMCILGCDFDTDPQLPWASVTLGGTAPTDQMDRAKTLHERMNEYLDKVAGPDNEFSIQALRRLQLASFDSIAAGSAGFDDAVTRGLRAIYPQKAECVGESVIQGLIQRGLDLSKKHSLSTHKGTALIVSLMFALGHGITVDPLYPWIGATLNDRLVTDPAARTDRLYSKTRVYLDRVLAHLGEG